VVVNALKTVKEEDFEFANPVEDFMVVQEEPDDRLGGDWEEIPEGLVFPKEHTNIQSRKKPEHALGEVDVPFTTEWVHEKLRDDPQLNEYHQVFNRTNEEGPSPIVQPLHYKKLVAAPGLEWYIGKTIEYIERETYQNLLLEFKDVFAWSNTDLTGISPQYGEHRIDLKEGSVPIRQRQYRLNPKYSL
jgi:hypothetical protein